MSKRHLLYAIKNLPCFTTKEIQRTRFTFFNFAYEKFIIAEFNTAVLTLSTFI
nr:MAG TPA: hypothetical protein [Caudoviricetes sp.]